LARAAWSDIELPLGPGYRLFLFSDGLIETANHRGEPFGLARTQDAAAELCGLPGAEFVLAMRRRMEAFSGCGAPRDDLTMLWLGQERPSV
jgi:serine phosphatase RsbU (regulator of sigma subunit)